MEIWAGNFALEDTVRAWRLSYFGRLGSKKDLF